MVLASPPIPCGFTSGEGALLITEKSDVESSYTRFLKRFVYQIVLASPPIPKEPPKGSGALLITEKSDVASSYILKAIRSQCQITLAVPPIPVGFMPGDGTNRITSPNVILYLFGWFYGDSFNIVPVYEIFKTVHMIVWHHVKVDFVGEFLNVCIVNDFVID